jgi:hypothetical protein
MSQTKEIQLEGNVLQILMGLATIMQTSVSAAVDNAVTWRSPGAVKHLTPNVLLEIARLDRVSSKFTVSCTL